MICPSWCDSPHAADEPCAVVVGSSGRRVVLAARLAVVGGLYVALVAPRRVVLAVDADEAERLAGGLDADERELVERAVELIGGAR